MLKKIVSGAIALFLGLMAVGFLGAPAHASETKKEPVCQATADGHYNQQLVARDSIINGRGDHGINENDIVAPFDYNFDGGPVEHYPGKNWTPENQILLNNMCKPAGNILTPVLPIPPVMTCLNEKTLTLTIPEQPKGLNVSSTSDDKGNYTVSFELPKNTGHNTYAFPAGFVNNVSIKTTDNRPSDPLWDPATGTCKMPDTGVHGVSANALIIGGGLVGAGLVAFSITNVMGRRKKS